jgi:hypothetical protein
MMEAAIGSECPHIWTSVVKAGSPRWWPSSYVIIQAIRLKLGKRMSRPQQRAAVRAAWLERVHEAENDLRMALLETQKAINEYYDVSPSDGYFALDKVLKHQHQAMDTYVAMCHMFTESILTGTPQGTAGSGEASTTTAT